MTLPNEHKPDAKSGNAPRVIMWSVNASHRFIRSGRQANTAIPVGDPRDGAIWKLSLKNFYASQITIRDGETERKLSLPAANIFAHGVKGAKGDARSTALYLNTLRQMGLLEEVDVRRSRPPSAVFRV